jgi:hypothetical protein
MKRNRARAEPGAQDQGQEDQEGGSTEYQAGAQTIRPEQEFDPVHPRRDDHAAEDVVDPVQLPRPAIDPDPPAGVMNVPQHQEGFPAGPAGHGNPVGRGGNDVGAVLS